MIDTPTLFLVVDAIPFDMALRAWSRGAMPGFSRPRPMISVFPSLTHVAVPRLLQGVMDIQPPGYEARYYHPESREIRGGLGDPEAEVGFSPYHTMLSSKQTRPGQLRERWARGMGLMSHLAVYLLQEKLAWQEIRWVRWRFQSAETPWLGYLAATDGIGHFGGREKLRASFDDINAQIMEARQDFARHSGQLPNVVMCSDHGMDFSEVSHLDTASLERMLAVGGLRAGPDGVVLAPMGDVSAGAAWCAPDQAEAAAALISEVVGVDLAVARTPDGFRVFRVTRGSREEARVRWDGARFQYTPLRGDPLDLLDRIGTAPISDQATLEATWDHHYPDPLHRILTGLTDLVQWPAPVLFSMADGWTFGPPLTHLVAEAMGGQVGTHGALSRTQSVGFVATCGLEAAEAGPIRAEDVFRPYGPMVRAGSRR